tara:strand:- start:96 stop:611 length:516 start_codon:yes stop_codon:yes gene_type:complete
MDFGTAIKTCFSKYADFNGKAGRAEFWYFELFVVIGGVIGLIIDVNVIGVSLERWGPAGIIISITLFLPALSVGARRLHDVGKSGWWQLLILTGIGIILLIIWWASEGTTKGYTESIKRRASVREYNDIPIQRSRSGKADLTDELEELQELYEDGTLSEAQFKKAKNKLLK